MRRADTLILGGGPAGAAAAIGLAEGGRAPLLIERERETGDALCGGFLSWATLARLARLGIETDRLGGWPVDRLRLFAASRRAEARLPAQAIGLSRHRLDTALLDRAAAAGARIERGVAAREIEAGRARIDGGWIGFDRLVLASGKHDVRGSPRPRDGGRETIGLRWRLARTPALDRLLDRAIELHLFRGGYAGLVRQEEGANLCIAVRRERLDEAGGRPEQLLAMLGAECPALADRLATAATIGAAQGVMRVPYGWRALRTERGVFRVGDQAAVIPSLAGEGIAIALASGAAAAASIMRGEEAGRFQPRLAASLRRPIASAAALWRWSERPAGAAALVAALGVAPTLARAAARLTRV